MKRRIKWIIMLCAVAFFLFVGGKLPGEALGDRAMVVGFGIDVISDAAIKISAQILDPSSDENAGQKTQVVTAEDVTISGAMNKISEKAGHSVALTHCNVVFICQKLAFSKNFYSILNYLITNNYLSENAFLFAVDGKSEELLVAPTAFSSNASLYVQKLVGTYAVYNDIATVTLQEFVMKYHSLSGVNVLPLIKKETVEKEQSEQPQKDTQYVFTFNDVYVLKNNDFVGEYDRNAVLAVNYVNNDLNKGRVECDGDHNEKINLYLVDKKSKFDYDLDRKTAQLSIKAEAVLKEIVDYGDSDSFVDRTDLSEAEKKRTEDRIKDTVLTFYKEMQALDVDIYGLKDGFFSEYGKKASSLALADIELSVKVDLKVHEV